MRRLTYDQTEALRAKILKLLDHHVHVSSVQKLKTRFHVSSSCTCGKKIDFSTSTSRSDWIQIMIDAAHHHEADMLVELFESELRRLRISTRKKKR